ncbi:hypothetical protein J2X68_007181 [Streptomyces sp. 3330]|uniref:hypothetical protein n=1 Tax=Streptomyces sp. 3330 TaxID=2817755 RepID=UPI00285FFD87|nr:hypothetical protein [Streptomyces sp. 3330]MDR6980441.1 hypothetical protein [Streptomyces sp. 3330]
MDVQITTALIGAVAVGGTIGGTVLGSWIQARSGRAQAAAARDAAVTTAQAAHDQAVRERVWTVMPVFLRATSEYIDALERSLQIEMDRDEVRAARRAFDLAYAEADLIVPEEMRTALGYLHGSQNGFLHVERTWGKSMRARHALDVLSESGDAEARRAVAALRPLERAGKQSRTHIVQPETPSDPALAVSALNAVTALTPSQRTLLINRAQRSPRASIDRLERARATHQRVRKTVIEQARAALGTAPPAGPVEEAPVPDSRTPPTEA